MGYLSTILIVAAVLLLLFIGWSIYDPVYNFLTGNIEVPPISSSADENIPSESETSSEEETEPEEPVEEQKTKAAVISLETASDTAKLDSFIADIKQQGYNSAVVEIKDVDGNVLYKTSNETITALNTVSESAFDLQALCTKLNDNGITPIVKINSFRDNASASAMSDAAVRYKPDTSYIWADDDPKNGGKYWLNPNSQKAQDYILAIIDDAVAMGAKGVILDTVQFPEGYSLDLCSFGEMNSKQEVLEGFIAKAEQKAAESEVKLYFEIPISGDYVSDNDQYGVSPFKIAAKNVVYDFVGASFKSGDVNVSDFNTDAAQKTAAVMGEISKISAQRENVMILLPQEAVSAAELDSIPETLATENSGNIEILTQSAE